MNESEVEAAAVRRITWRLLPFLMLCYFVAYVDRVNVGFAALQMNKELGIGPTAFGLAGGMFFVSYLLFEVPSNLAMERFGARRWIARIMVSWGLVSAAMALAAGPWSLYVLRFLLGAAEAGFFPGVILYLTYWYPAEHRAKVIGLFMIAIPISGLAGSPISAALLELHGWLGLRGWQWLFLLEGLPAVALGAVVLFVLPDRPRDAAWLSAEQKAWLERRLQAERARTTRVAQLSVWRVITNRHVLVLALVYAGSSAVSNGLTLWQPQILKSYGLTTMQTGLMNSIPFGVASLAMVWWGLRSDRSGERVLNTAIPLAVASAGLLLTLFAPGLWGVVAALCLALVGTYAVKGPFWALSTEWLSAGTAAVGIAQVNALGNFAGFASSYLIGAIKERTDSYPLALTPLVLLAAAACVAVLVSGRRAAAAAPAE